MCYDFRSFGLRVERLVVVSICVKYWTWVEAKRLTMATIMSVTSVPRKSTDMFQIFYLKLTICL